MILLLNLFNKPVSPALELAAYILSVRVLLLHPPTTAWTFSNYHKTNCKNHVVMVKLNINKVTKVSLFTILFISHYSENVNNKSHRREKNVSRQPSERMEN